MVRPEPALLLVSLVSLVSVAPGETRGKGQPFEPNLQKISQQPFATFSCGPKKSRV